MEQQQAETPTQASEFEGHTPEPWHRNIKADGRYPTVFAGRNTHVAVASQMATAQETEANISLIAAAPRLLRERDELIAIVQMLVRFANDPKTFAVYKEGNIYDREQCVRDTINLLARLNKQGGGSC